MTMIEIVIDCAEEMGVPCEDGVYVSPPADECCSTCVLFGDANYDGTLNILDVIMLVDIILEVVNALNGLNVQRM